MPPESKKLLWDMRLAATRIGQFTSGKDEQAFLDDVLLRSAVERQFEIVGEALTQLRKLDAATAARVTDSAKIIGFRNILIHAYANVDAAITWRIVQENLPVPLQELDVLLAEPEP